MNWNTIQQSDDRAVSPVIGVILMVAVAVILAAIVSMLVMGMGEDVNAKPQVSFTFENESSGVVITHDGGDALNKAQVTVKVNGADDSPTSDWGSDPITAATSYQTGAVSSGDVVKVVWEGDNGETTTLATYEVP